MHHSSDERCAMMTLSRLGYHHPVEIRELYRQAGSAEAVWTHRKDLRQIVPEASPKLSELLSNGERTMQRMAQEEEWAAQHGIRILCMGETDYPQRLAECVDAPLVLYYCGTADLNARRMVSVVGTRHCTLYGQDMIGTFLKELKQWCGTETVIVSGLAYGVDVCAHRTALACGMHTVGVLAHGLDTIYPARHRETAKSMLHAGGLLTEHISGSKADKVNFVRRNRIVAGISDATILVESAEKGGGLITCAIAGSYDREVFAFPGNANAPYSRGCNNLIRDCKAQLVSSAEDFVRLMGWQDDRTLQQARRQGIERQMFPELKAEEQQIVDILRRNNDMQLNMLANKAGMSVAQAAATLFDLELSGMVRAMPGGVYHLSE